MQRRKEYVDILLAVTADGFIRPGKLKFGDNDVYTVDRVIDVRRAASTKVGGTGIRYTVEICGKRTFIFEDEGRWFVEAKTNNCFNY